MSIHYINISLVHRRTLILRCAVCLSSSDVAWLQNLSALLTTLTLLDIFLSFLKSKKTLICMLLLVFEPENLSV